MDQTSRRLEFHQILINLLGTNGQKKSRVYFQPPSGFKMDYPCIVYSRSDMNKRASNDQLYGYTTGYTVTVIDPIPDSPLLAKILNLPMSRWIRHYTADNLNHDVYSVYY